MANEKKNQTIQWTNYLAVIECIKNGFSIGKRADTITNVYKHFGTFMENLINQNEQHHI